MIEVRGLHFTYPNRSQQTLRGLDFVIPTGEIFGFLGPSGAGKSTTQKLLIGLLKGYQGSVQVMGSEIRDIGPDYYERIGVAFEFPNFYSKFTVLENLKLFRSLYKGENRGSHASAGTSQSCRCCKHEGVPAVQRDEDEAELLPGAAARPGYPLSG